MALAPKCGREGLDPYDLCSARCERPAGHKGACDVAYSSGGHGQCEAVEPFCEREGCGQVKAYNGARFCGAACSALSEGGK
jgi:hypothetical protein